MKKLVSMLVLFGVLIGAACSPAPTAQPAPTSAPVATQAPAPTAVPPSPVTLRALFMKQAGYSEDDINNITKEYMAKNPNVKVELDFVSYEALHDKIVTAAASKAGTYDVVLMDCI